MAHDMEKELGHIFLQHHRVVLLRSSGDSPFDHLTAKGDFGRIAEDLYKKLNDQRKSSNSDSIDKVLVELYALGYMLNYNITLQDERISYYNQQLKKINPSHYDELHKLLVKMEVETARVVNHQEMLDSTMYRIQLAKSAIAGLKESIRAGELMKEAGFWVLVGGCLGGLFLTVVGLFTGNLWIAGGGIAALVGGVVGGGAALIAGEVTVTNAKKELEKWQTNLDSLEKEKDRLQKAIDEGSKKTIQEVEDRAKHALGIHN